MGDEETSTTISGSAVKSEPEIPFSLSHKTGQNVVADEIDISIRTTRAPDALSTFQIGDPKGSHLGVTDVTAGGHQVSGTVDRLGATLNLTSSQGVVSHIGAMTNLAYASLSFPVGDHTFTDFMGGTRNTGVSGFSVSTPVHNFDLSGSFALAIAAKAGITPLTYDPQNQRYLLSYDTTVSAGAQAMFGASSGHVGTGLRFGFSGNMKMTIHSWRTCCETAKLVRNSTLVRSMKAVFRVGPPLMPLPKLTDPLNKQPIKNDKYQAPFQVNDEVCFENTGTLTGGVAFIGGGICYGLHASMTSTNSWSIQKVSPTSVDVIVTPKHVTQAVAMAVDFPVLAEAHTMISRSKATQYAFHFDCSIPTGLASFLGLIKEKRIPGPLLEVNDYRVLDAKSAQNNLVSAELPEGVTYLYMAQSSIPVARTAGFAFTLTRLIPFVDWAGIGLDKRTVREQTVAANSQGAVHHDRISRVKEWQFFRRGVTEETSYGDIAEVYLPSGNSRKLESLTLAVSLETDRTNFAVQNKVVERLNRDFLPSDPLQPLPKDNGKGKKKHKYGKSVTIRREITFDKLQDLTPEGTTPQAYGKELSKKIARGGLKTLAQLDDEMGEKSKPIPAPTVVIESAAPDALYSKVLALSARYNDKINPFTQSSKDISERIKNVNHYRKRIAEVLQVVEIDPMLERLDPLSKNSQLDSLRESDAALKNMVRIENPGPFVYNLVKSTVSKEARDILIKWERERKK